MTSDARKKIPLIIEERIYTRVYVFSCSKFSVVASIRVRFSRILKHTKASPNPSPPIENSKNSALSRARYRVVAIRADSHRPRRTYYEKDYRRAAINTTINRHHKSPALLPLVSISLSTPLSDPGWISAATTTRMTTRWRRRDEVEEAEKERTPPLCVGRGTDARTRFLKRRWGREGALSR